MRTDPARHRDGRFAEEPREEAVTVDLAASLDPGTAPRPDWPDVYWDERPATAAYRDLAGLVSDTDPYAHATGEAWVKEQTARLVRSYDLTDVSCAMSPAEWADSIDWEDDEDGEERDHEEDMYTDLAEVLVNSPWDVPPILVVEHVDGTKDVLDGNHRAGLNLHEGIKRFPAYVITEPPGVECKRCDARAHYAAIVAQRNATQHSA